MKKRELLERVEALEAEMDEVKADLDDLRTVFEVLVEGLQGVLRR